MTVAELEARFRAACSSYLRACELVDDAMAEAAERPEIRRMLPAEATARQRQAELEDDVRKAGEALRVGRR